MTTDERLETAEKLLGEWIAFQASLPNLVSFPHRNLLRRSLEFFRVPVERELRETPSTDATGSESSN